MSNPPINLGSTEAGPEDKNRYLTIHGDVHYTPNDISELKKNSLMTILNLQLESFQIGVRRRCHHIESNA